jgi:hypothetical protein
MKGSSRWMLGATLAAAFLSAAQSANSAGGAASSQEENDQVLFQKLYGSTPPRTLAECEQFFSAKVRAECQNRVAGQ